MAGVVVITGGSGGIGMAAARALAGTGPVLLADLDPARLDAAVADLRASGIEAEGAICDVGDLESVSALVAATRAAGPLGVVVHTAGVAPPAATDPELVFRVNAVGTQNVLEGMVPLAVEGTVAVSVASVAGHRAFTAEYASHLVSPRNSYPQLVASGAVRDSALRSYSLSKASVILQTQAGAAAWGARGARIVSVSPGLVVDTLIGEAAQQIHAGAYAQLSAVKRAGVAREVGGMIAMLASDVAAYVTGTDLLIDGGVIAQYRHHSPEADRAAWEVAYVE